MRPQPAFPHRGARRDSGNSMVVKDISTEVEALPEALDLSPVEIIADFPGPALLFGGRGAVLAANEAAKPVVAAIEAGRLPQIGESVAQVYESGRAIADKISLNEGGEETTLDITLLPLGAGRTAVPLGAERGAGPRFVLALSRESTLERNFINALVSSRQLFKDLVGCSSDFAWETDTKGVLGFVSGRGALGYAARELYGRRPRAMLAEAEEEGASALPFETRVPVEDVEVWLFDADGKPACLVTSSVPVTDDSGVWIGARGVCRDVTEARRKDAALELARQRERLLGEIVDSIRTEVEPDEMLRAAARAAAQGLGAGFCWIVRAQPDGTLSQAVQWAGRVRRVPANAVAAVAQELATSESGAAVQTLQGDLQVLACVSRYHDTVNGGICVARSAAEPAWDDDAVRLISGVADHLGIALAQIESHEKMELLSRVDELTGLLNRRAFFADIANRLQVLQRRGRAASLFYIDLDNFKLVNDVHGHKRGDDALLALSRLLTDGTRVGDIVARLGGDEFAMWLEETDEEAAAGKARDLLDRSADLQVYSGSPERPLGISIGIAVTDPQSGEALKTLIARADSAMYRVKKDKKGSFAFAHTAPAEDGA